MTGALSPRDGIPTNIYPQYCFHLSPTISRWCPLRATSIQGLQKHPGFEGQDLYFHGNHPIKWVRIVGVVVAMDEYEGRHNYTVDDSSGATVECVVDKPPSATAAVGTARQSMQQTASAGTDNGEIVDIDAEIDVGDVVDVRGSIRLFRQTRKVRVKKVIHLRSTELEVRFWDKLIHFHEEILDKPWTLTRKEVRRCRKAAEGLDKATDMDRDQMRRERKAVGADGSRRRQVGAGPNNSRGGRAARPIVTGLEKKAKRSHKTVHLEGEYAALGL